MLNVFNNDIKFCDASIKPWIIWLSVFTVVVLGWGIYQRDTLDPDRLAEKAGEHLEKNSAVLAGGQVPQQADNTVYAAITKATPQGSGRLVASVNGASLQEQFKQIIASVRPTVVNIKATKMNANPGAVSPSANTQVRFADPYGASTPGNTDGVYESVGSGIIVSPQGHILTNYHVIANANKILVTVYGMGKQKYTAKILDHHVDTDLTLLKIDTMEELEVAPLGNSDFVEVGDFILTFGSPFGLEQTVTDGIVSGRRKSIVIEGMTYTNMIQTDAPINRGSSGGPLVNLNAEVIGINTAIYAPTGVFSGTGFAIPVNQVKQFLAAHNVIPAGAFIQAHNPSFQQPQGWLGVEIQPVDRTIAYHFGLPYIGGVLVNRVIYNSPAWNEGLERDDIILEFDGRKVSSMKKLENLIMDLGPTEKVKVVVFRDNKINEFYITLSGMPQNIEMVR